MHRVRLLTIGCASLLGSEYLYVLSQKLAACTAASLLTVPMHIALIVPLLLFIPQMLLYQAALSLTALFKADANWS